MPSSSLAQQRCGPLTSVSRILVRPGSDGQPDVLFVADWRASTVFAFELEDSRWPRLPAPKQGEPITPFVKIEDISAALPDDLRGQQVHLEDIAVRPGTEEIYASISVGPDKLPLVVRALRDSSLEVMELAARTCTHKVLGDVIEDGFDLWEDLPARTYTVTAMCWHDGRLFVAGVGNKDFRAALRMLPYPFTDDALDVKVEIYHLGHRQTETRAPIRAMNVLMLDEASPPRGQAPKKVPWLVAGYLCAPLSVFPVADLLASEPGQVHTGKTIGELGSGGIPYGIFRYKAVKDPFTSDMSDLVFIGIELRQSVIMPYATLNATTSANVPPFSDKIDSYVTGWDGTLRPGEVRRFAGFYTEHTAGVFDLQLKYTYRAAYDDGVGGHAPADHIVTLRRDIPTGRAQIIGIGTMIMLHMADWNPREYDFILPGKQTDDPKYWAPVTDFDMFAVKYYNQVKDQEGFSNLKQWVPPRKDGAGGGGGGKPGGSSEQAAGDGPAKQ